MHTLFLVDDNTVDHFIMMNNLKRNPIFENVKRFDSGDSLIEHLMGSVGHSDDLPDVIFLDLNMPQFDGWDVLDALKPIYDKFVKEIIVYIISASINRKDYTRAFTYPFVRNFFSKPITKDNFILLSSDIESHWNES